ARSAGHDVVSSLHGGRLLSDSCFGNRILSNRQPTAAYQPSTKLGTPSRFEHATCIGSDNATLWPFSDVIHIDAQVAVPLKWKQQFPVAPGSRATRNEIPVLCQVSGR